MSDASEEPHPTTPTASGRTSILIVAWELQPYGGLETRLRTLVLAAADRGWTTTLVTARPLPDGALRRALTGTGSAPIELESQWRRSASGRFAVALGRLKAAVTSRSTRPLLDRTGHYGHRSFTRFVATYWDAQGSELLSGSTVVHLVGAPKEFLVQTLRAARGAGRPAAYQAVHEVSAEYVRRAHYAPFVDNCNMCAMIFTSHARQTQDFREHFRYEGRATEVPQWCFEDEGPLLAIDRPAHLERVRIGSLCRLDEVKGLDTLIEAAAVAADAGAPFELVLGGSGPIETSLRDLARDRGVIDRVRFVGQVDDRAAFYRSLDVFVLGSTAEGGPITGVEAMAAGLPILTTPVGAMPERVQDERSALFFPIGDARTLAALIGRLSKDAALRQRLGAAARADYVDRFRSDLHESTMIDELGRLSEAAAVRS